MIHAFRGSLKKKFTDKMKKKKRLLAIGCWFSIHLIKK